MHSFLNRGNAIIAYSLSVLALLTFICFLSTEFLDYRAKVKISTPKILVKNVPDYSVSRKENDLGFLTFDLEADLTPLFNWNVKQLFLFLSAEYSTPNNALNQVCAFPGKPDNISANLSDTLRVCQKQVNPEMPVKSKLKTLNVMKAMYLESTVNGGHTVTLWDKIILKGDNKQLDFKNMNIKYYFWDDGHGLKGNPNVTLTLSWNIIPNAGRLPIIQAIGSHSFKFPSEYTTDRI